MSLIKEFSTKNPEILNERITETHFSQVWEIFVEKLQ
jgi:hypothetical protein